MQDLPLFRFGIGLGNSSQQRPCIGVFGIVKEGMSICDFHDLSQIHDGHVVTYVLYHAQVMGDENDLNTS